MSFILCVNTEFGQTDRVYIHWQSQEQEEEQGEEVEREGRREEDEFLGFTQFDL